MESARPGRWVWTLAAALVLGSAPLGAACAEVAEEKPAESARPEDRDAVLKALNRPERTVEPPTLDAAGVDGLIKRALDEEKVNPAHVIDDGQFVRRVHLDLTGKPPTPEQVRVFVAARGPGKRSRLIDTLLDSRDYAENWARYWRDVIRYHATFQNARLVDYPKLEGWLADQFAANTPWDEVAREIITATGPTEQNGAGVFTAAHQGKPVEIAGEVSRIFLGMQIQCAECHDHPSDPWTREQFHQFAAFFAGVRSRRDGKPGQVRGALIVAQPRAPRYKMPDLEDPKKSIPVDPKFFLASSEEPVPRRLTTQQRRELAASFVTGQDNPWFARAFVNRVWSELMGQGFYMPVDDLGPARDPQDPEVIEALASQFQRGGYDVKWLFRTILNTRAYQREFKPLRTAAGQTPFAANCPGRLRADQILDALGQALGFDPDAPRFQVGRVRGKPGAAANGPRRSLRNPRFLANYLFGFDPSTPGDEVLGTIPQALFLMNSPQLHRAIRALPGTTLGEVLAAHPDDRSALDALYLRVLARRPTPAEVAVCARYLRQVGNRTQAFEDILWSLINTTEFISRR